MLVLVLQIILIGLSLAIDAFAVSVTDGMCYKNLNKGKAVTIPLTFGIFQAAMPLAGFFLGSLFAKQIDAFDHYIAFFLLLIIGGKMVVDGIKEWRSTDGEVKVKKFFYPEVLLQGVATSIDALATGFALIPMLAQSNVGMYNIFWLVAIIGIITFVLSSIGIFIGTKIGKLFKNKACIAEIIGGLVLVGIGIKILVEGIIG